MNGAIYAATMLLSIVTCSILLTRTQRRLNLSWQQKLTMAVGGFCGAMVFAKLPFLITGIWDANESFFWINGKTITLGIAGGYLGVEIAKRWDGVTQKTGDSFAMPVAVGIALGRLACFSGGCCYGLPTDLPWGIHFDLIDGAQPIFRHPTQIYEFIFHSGCAFGLWIAYRRLYDLPSTVSPIQPWEQIWLRGDLIKIYFLTYFAYRFLTEFIRPEPIFDIGLTFYQMSSIFLFFVFATLWLVEVAHKKNLVMNAIHNEV